MADQIMLGLKVTVLGLGTTFVALFGLIVVINLINKILNSGVQDKKKPDSPSEEAINTPVRVEENHTDDEDEELIAVITAAIAASLNRSTHDLVVKKVKRVPYHAPAWNVASRSEQISTRR